VGDRNLSALVPGIWCLLWLLETTGWLSVTLDSAVA